jgi:hypothetical protein
MENCRSISLAIVFMALISTARAEQKPVPMDGAAIISVFEGQTVSGSYVEGKPFRETYAVTGAIDYWDSDVATTGQWSVVQNLLCTFYDGIAGGCFRIIKISANCFDYYTASAEVPNSSTPIEPLYYTARGHTAHSPSTCPTDLQT